MECGKAALDVTEWINIDLSMSKSIMFLLSFFAISLHTVSNKMANQPNKQTLVSKEMCKSFILILRLWWLRGEAWILSMQKKKKQMYGNKKESYKSCMHRYLVICICF